jgi:polysaccharide pyruvyl transferase WcaK-like protein
MKKSINIFLSERIPSENRGEAAILEGIVEGLEIIASGNYLLTIYSMRLKQDREYYGEFGNVVGFNYSNGENLAFQDKIARYMLSVKLFLSGILKKLFNYDLVFSDTLFKAFSSADIILQGHDNVYRHAIKWKDALVVFYAKQHKKKVMIPGASIGPFKMKSYFHKLLVSYVLDNSDLITLRDVQSAQFLDSIGFCDRYHTLTDIAFLLKPRKVSIPWNQSKVTIGFTPTEYVLQALRAANLDRNTKSLDFAIFEISDYMIWMATEFDANVILIPHVYGPEKKQDDRQLIDRIYVECRKKSPTIDFCNLNQDLYKASELKFLIGNLDLLVACRTHSLIAALGMNVPVIALTEPNRYKTNGILGHLFEMKENLYNVEDWDIDEIKKRTSIIMSDRKTIKKKIEKKLPSAKQLAEENFLLLKKLIDL